MNIAAGVFTTLGAALFIVACNSPLKAPHRTDHSTNVERMYVIACGENHATDLSPWTTAADKGKPYVFSNNCYLIRHRAGWLLWDSGNADRIGNAGLVNPRGTLTAYMRKPLTESLREIGVKPQDIKHFAMSHSHGDHSGNANLFPEASIYMQAAEYAAIHGPEPQKLGITPANFQNLRAENIVKLAGDHDVFGDGSVVIKSTPGHTPGHQSLFVLLPRTGPVLLSGDMVHLKANWDFKRVPSINYNAEQSARSMHDMEQFINRTRAQLWINHDAEQSRTIPKAPAFVE
jgi:glyoxylase-like metal-dependent hydrolase (beta-lactamase superfamily II)